ncbi:MAG: acyl-CoA reductase [Bacteroidia bacterium]
MTLEQRKLAFVELGKEIESAINTGLPTDNLNIRQQQLRILAERLSETNGWFSHENVQYALESISNILKENSLTEWLNSYNLPKSETEELNTVGVVMAGNIPAVGFHDFLSILISGNKIKAKLSSSDRVLIPAFAAMLIAIEPLFAERISFTEERLNSIDAIIATGSNNSSRYFDYYFSRFPNIIRKNRTSVAILSGSESEVELKALFKDIFQYYGLGCRNVSKVFIPEKYNLIELLNQAVGWEHLADNKKYFNNYEYNKAIYLVNGVAHFDNGYLLLKEDEGFSSPVSVVFYEKYSELSQLKEKLSSNREQLQCIVASTPLGIDAIPFGTTQNPAVKDYADRTDTLSFLSSIKKASQNETI